MSAQEGPDGADRQQVASAPSGIPRRASFVRDLRILWAERAFRRLFSTRLISQLGDGIFTAGVGTYVFFNATTYPNPAKAAAAFAVLYGPYSLIGPFAGVFIDRWSRRQILSYSALLRSAFVVITAVLMAAGNLGVPLYVAVLLVLGVNRFFLASLSAALPHVVAGDKLVTANSVSPTAGGTLAAIGALVGVGVNAGTGDTERGAAITLLVAGVCYISASLVARTMPRDSLGPAREPGQLPAGRLMAEFRIVAAGLAGGVRFVVRRRGPAAAIAAIGGNRFFYGILFLMSILLYRNFFYLGAKASTAETHYGYLAAAGAVGYFLSAILTPSVARRLSKPAVIALTLGASAVLIGVLGQTFNQIAYIFMAFCLGLAGQATAICVTTVLQEQLPDEYRGRAFSYYDMMFNITFAAGVLICLPFMPTNGKSAALMAFVAVGYAAVASGYWVFSRQLAGPESSPAGSGGPDGGTSSPADAAQASNS